MSALEKIYALCVLALMLMTIVLPFVFDAPASQLSLHFLEPSLMPLPSPKPKP